jgi:FixJ family two-component response regulator
MRTLPLNGNNRRDGAFADTALSIDPARKRTSMTHCGTQLQPTARSMEEHALDAPILGLSSPELQVCLSELGSTLPSIFLTGHADIPTKVRTNRARAEDFTKRGERRVARRQATRPLNSKLDVVHARLAALTPREREVFALVVRGKTNKEAARALGCTDRTITARRHKVMEKMQVQSVAELVAVAERVGVASVAGQQS